MNSIPLLGLILTFAIFIVTITYHVGRLSARVESLEIWRTSIRVDMHEISEKLEVISTELKQLTTLVDERTERRTILKNP